MTTQTAASSRGRRTVVTVVGESDEQDAARFRSALTLHTALARAGVTFDLTGLTGWQPASQAALLRLIRRLEAGGHDVQVTGLTGRAADEARRSGLDGHLRR